MLPEFGQKVVSYWFSKRHTSDFARNMARVCIRDAKLWKRTFRN